MTLARATRLASPILAISLGLIALSGCIRANSGGASGSDSATPSYAFNAQLTIEHPLDDGAGYSAYLVSYRSDGLKVYAMVAVPDAPPPQDGYPILVANHGYHPDPPQYGIRSDGRNARPGDYYSDVPGNYTAMGFLVVMPDYRGHNQSEGVRFTDGRLATVYYARDVLYLLSAIDQLQQGNPDQVYLWGHSMGGEVSLRVLLALPSERIRAASLWAPMSAPLLETAIHYHRFGEGFGGQIDAQALYTRLRDELSMPPQPLGPNPVDPMHSVHEVTTPIVIHHARGDGSVPFVWSERLTAKRIRAAQPHELYVYPSNDHLLKDAEAQQALHRDQTFLRDKGARDPRQSEPAGSR